MSEQQLSTILYKMGVINKSEHEKLLSELLVTSASETETLIGKGLVTENNIRHALKEYFHVEYFVLDSPGVYSVLKIKPLSLLKKLKVIPISFSVNKGETPSIILVMLNPEDENAFDEGKHLVKATLNNELNISKAVVNDLDYLFLSSSLSKSPNILTPQMHRFFVDFRLHLKPKKINTLDPDPYSLNKISTPHFYKISEELSLYNISSNQTEGTIVPVWFGTNRKPIKEEATIGLSNERSSTLFYGKVEVLVPKYHRKGETGSNFLQKIVRRDFRDDQLKLTNHFELTKTDFYQDIKNVMLNAKNLFDKSHGLIFIHGYNVSFEGAAIQAAQLSYDLNVEGATAFFSWPSYGQMLKYPADEATIDASERLITEFLVEFTKNSGADKVHIIAHSMGNRGLLRALQRIASKANEASNIKFGQIFLAAPDVDRDIFLELAHLYPLYSDRTTLYASNRDIPVAASRYFHNAPRAGYFEPYTISPGVDTIAVPSFSLDLLGHGYFAKAKELIYDMGSLMRINNPPYRRQSLIKSQDNGQNFWRFIR